MIPGPVFAVELLTIARRARYYALRVLYGMALLLVLWLSYRAFLDGPGRDSVLFAPGEMAESARMTFRNFVVAQGLVVLAITPAMVGGTIAGEKQRKTLHYLLASQLSSGEIVFGKLLARMLLVFVYLAAGVPVLFIIRFFGGVDAELILLDFGLTVSFALYLAAQSIFFSTVMRQARSAILASYGLILFWFLAPALARFSSVLFPNALPWLPEAVALVSPIVDVWWIFDPWRRATIQESVPRLVIAQATYSALFLAYPTWRLRAIAANQTARPRLVLRLDNSGRASWKPLPRPPVGDDAMLWKERYTSRTGGILKMLALLNTLFWATLTGCLLFDYARTSLVEMFRSWFTRFGGGTTNREEFLNMIRTISPWVAGVWVLATASSAAASIASEREDDTWISLLATDLEGREILRAKMLGAILRSKWLGLLLVTTWTVGLLGGAVHPLSFAVASAEMAAFLWFAAALGVRCSLTSSSTSKALALTLGTLAFTNGGYLLLCLPIFPSMYGLMMPYVIHHGLFGAAEVQQFDAAASSPISSPLLSRDWAVTPSVVGVVFYATLAAYFTRWAFSRFDAIADRPDDSG